jgi:type I restriction enzyme S subunit
MKRYKQYKDSGVEWIGEVPRHWEVSKVKYHYDLISGYPFDSEDITNEMHQYPVIRIGNVSSGDVDVFYSGELNDKHPVVHSGDLIVSLTGDFSIRQWANVTSLLNQRCGLIRNIDPNVLDRIMFYQIPFSLMELGNTKYFTTLKNLSNSEFLDIRVVLPPLPEQTQIVAYLDDKTAAIDDLIRKKERKIALLKEYRSALINRAVTKGLDPNVPMKDSGVEWIGEVPGHWEFTKVKHQFKISGGGTPSTEKPEYWDGDIPWVSSKDMKTKYIHETVDYITETGLHNSTCSLIQPDALLIVVRSGILQRTIPVAINKVPLAVNQDQKVLISKGELSIEFFYYYIIGNENFLLQEWIKEGTTVESIEMDYLLNFGFYYPSFSEQQQIVAYLDEQTAETDAAMELEQQKIALLKEYRQSLISSVVTGKSNVTDQ